ncbi:MAG: ATP-dependent RecD-like DNA helicase [Clostridiales Family XIII bacterium]|jgi:flagellar biosynthesis GTPase FlhF|nr:ATP-dependent RecD-like DNA helicase [Clostridiales Family XIII bacterium]
MVQHLSVRVPWHDHGWDGTVCCHPEKNQACRILKNIAEKKNDEKEIAYAGKPFDLEGTPPCVGESGMFMSPTENVMPVHHPYSPPYRKKGHEYFTHICDTDIVIPPYSFLGRPFRWTLRKDDRGDTLPHEIYFTQFDDSIEVDVGKGDWISNGNNQRNIFNYFYQDVEEYSSMIIAYAKTVPFIESAGRIIIGIGVLNSLGDQEQYKYSANVSDDDMDALLWERKLGHSIREDRNDGFLFPFNAIQTYLKEHPEQNPDELIVIAPDDYFEEFSFATEHLSHDALIQVLNKTITILNKYKEINLDYGDGSDWDYCLKWCREKLANIWLDRGAYPGLGAVLSAMGIPFGFDVAKAIKAKLADEKIWDELADAIGRLEEYLPENKTAISKRITKSILRTVRYELDEQRPFLELLSRLTLTIDQANLLLNPDKVKIYNKKSLTDIFNINNLIEKVVGNPYILYEQTRLLELKYQFGICQIDLGLYPNKIVEGIFPQVPEPSNIEDPDDERRLRAIITSILEMETENGSTFTLIDDITRRVNEFRSDVIEIETDIRKKTILALDADGIFDGLFNRQEVVLEIDQEKVDGIAYQLDRITKIDTLIKNIIRPRLKKDIDINDNWDLLLEQVLGKKVPGDEHESKSREEKAIAIRKMAQSEVSVLTGGAGTGKTTTLVALCMNKTIQDEGILVLAPTGKAMVVLKQKLREQGINPVARTLFQYLLKSHHCDFNTWSYYLSGEKDPSVPAQTVIVDESSMLTEEMFGALIEAAQSAKRIIFVGDPNQLPPIGAGKPFWELVQVLRNMPDQPRYASLLISNRQKKSGGDNDRLDVELSKLFTEDQAKEVGDNIFERIASDDTNIKIISYKNTDELEALLFDTIVEITQMENVYGTEHQGMTDIDDIDGFDYSIGGIANGEWMNFGKVELVDAWQILSPYRNNEVSGTTTINRYIHDHYRPNKNVDGYHKKKFTNNPLGNGSILYGEKVINIKNQERGKYGKGFPSDGCENYIANGETGLVTGLYPESRRGKNEYHNVEFSSQQGFTYGFKSGVSEREKDIELAYALTIHKAQGSGFKATIFVINEPDKGINPFITREMVYTALTRQSEKIYILYNKEPWELKHYTAPEYSDLARRKTNLFIAKPVIREYKSGWYDQNLIHVTIADEQVRSKSEVIIANELYHAKKNYIYEKQITLDDGSNWLPDFTIRTSDGSDVYWEHLGMMGDYNYRRKWEGKKTHYQMNGISEENGNLIVTEDTSSGGINAKEIAEIIKTRL